MAGPQDVVIKLPSQHCFLVKTRPARFFTRIPYFGTLLSYDLGKPVAFKLTIQYLGYQLSEGVYDIDAKPPLYEWENWTQDIVLEIEGEPVGSGDDLSIDVDKTAYQEETQNFSTKPLFLERLGGAQLQIGPPYQIAYMFEVKEASTTIVGWIAAVLTVLIGAGAAWGILKF